MTEFAIPTPAEWAPCTSLEYTCLSEARPDHQATPLFHAASLRWLTLCRRLLQSGSRPQSRCYDLSIDTGIHFPTSIFSQLLKITNNKRGEVETLLHESLSMSLDTRLSLSDLKALVHSAPSLHTTIDSTWNNSVTWSPMRGHRHRLAALWEVVSQVDAAQELPFCQQSNTSRLIVDAARRRDANAIYSLLALGFDANGFVGGWRMPLQKQTTALDMVSWTADVKSLGVSESLLTEDANLTTILKDHGGVRGLHFTQEYQIAMTLFFEILPLAIVALGTAGFVVLVFKGSKFCFNAGLALRNEAVDEALSQEEGTADVTLFLLYLMYWWHIAWLPLAVIFIPVYIMSNSDDHFNFDLGFISIILFIFLPNWIFVIKCIGFKALMYTFTSAIGFVDFIPAAIGLGIYLVFSIEYHTSVFRKSAATEIDNLHPREIGLYRFSTLQRTENSTSDYTIQNSGLLHPLSTWMSCWRSNDGIRLGDDENSRSGQ